jgi:hypothetical protein
MNNDTAVGYRQARHRQTPLNPAAATQSTVAAGDLESQKRNRLIWS